MPPLTLADVLRVEWDVDGPEVAVLALVAVDAGRVVPTVLTHAAAWPHSPGQLSVIGDART